MGALKIKEWNAPAIWGAGIGGIIIVVADAFGSGLLKHSIVVHGDVLKSIGHYFGYFFTSIPGLVVVGLTILAYVIAAVSARSDLDKSEESDLTAVFRGILISTSSIVNALLTYNILSSLAGAPAGIIVGIVIGALGLLSSFGGISQSAVYQGFIGWTCWLAPMSWPIIALGLTFLAISLVLWFPLGSPIKVELFRIGGDKPAAGAAVQGKILDADWGTGTFFLVGGLVGNLNYAKTAYNMGNLGFIHRKAQSDYTPHESGHTLSLFAFGWIFHLLGAADENIVSNLMGSPDKAFAELLAESHDGSGNNRLEMWA